MSKLSYIIITVAVLCQLIFLPARVLAQSANASGSGIGTSAVTSGTLNTPGSVGATFAPQGGIGIQNYGVSNASVTGVGAPNVTDGSMGSTFTPQGSTGIQNYGTTNPGTLPNMGMVPLPNFSSSSNFGTTNNYGTSPSYGSAIPTVLPNPLIAPLPNFGSLNQNGLNSSGLNSKP